MAPLSSDLRKLLDKKVVAARDAAESACQASLTTLGVEAGEAPASLGPDQRQLRNALRAKQRQLAGDFEQLVAECAYEQWHLMLFARFLAENGLLIHPDYGAAVTLEEVVELSREQGQSDPWLLAASYAEAMLPGIFRPSDPCVRLPLTPEGRKRLEDILASLPSEVFTADDALGWVYQFWQTKKKKEVNASERKIGGADLAPVTQLFTEHYMVRFLLENSLGAWWAARHPDSSLLASFAYLRFSDDGWPAAGCFEGWPESIAEITVMDPCCGSGHFLVAAFEMLRRMREEEEGLSEHEAVDAVLRDNLFGLELDARCVQIAAFALALAAWKAVGYHELPSLKLACSGIPTRGNLEEWTKLAKGDERLERALTKLHELFREADTLGSLIDPRRAVEDGTLMSVPLEEVAPLLEQALADGADPVAAVFGDSAREVTRAAMLLSRTYTLVGTNVPYLKRSNQVTVLQEHSRVHYPDAAGDLATCMLSRCSAMTAQAGTTCLVLPEKWRFLVSYRSLRRWILGQCVVNVLARLGVRAFSTSLWDLGISLLILANLAPGQDVVVVEIDASAGATSNEVDERLRRAPACAFNQVSQLANPDARVSGTDTRSSGNLLEVFAECLAGIQSGDYSHFGRCFWEVARVVDPWRFQQSTVSSNTAFGGREHMLLWESEGSVLAAQPGAYIRGLAALHREGVAVSQTGALHVTRYAGDLCDNNTAMVVPRSEEWMPPVLAFLFSPEFPDEVRKLDTALKVTNATLGKVPFDLEYWSTVAADQYPDGLPEPHSDDPTQWLFQGKVIGSEQPLHVALARMLGYRWPDQETDELDHFADEDGIVCLPSIVGERRAHERLRELLAAAYGECFSQHTIDDLLVAEKSKTLEVWLRDKAFASHVKLFHSRPFIWHVWDGRADGFAALLNYHKLDEQTLQKLTYNHLGWWIDRQKADVAAENPGAEARLAAAVGLQDKLKLILEGEPPHDIYVRWKPLAEQPLGWQPDLNDGVRLNIRPFVTAGVLRSKFSIHWKRDRGKNPDGSERLNDLHFTLAERRAAREGAEAGG
jgi:hypothetical protein